MNASVNRSSEFLERLLNASHYSEWLKIFNTPDRTNPKPITYAEMTRRAGFKSRSYIREVAVGKKPLTVKASHRFAEAMRLSGDWRRLFLEMVIAETSQGGPPSTAEVSRLRSHLRKLHVSKQREVGKEALAVQYLAPIFAAVKQGSRLDYIKSATGIPEDRLRAELDAMAKLGIIRQMEDARGVHYFREADFIKIRSENREVDFTQTMRNELTRINHLLVTAKYRKSSATLITSGAFSVKSSDLPLIKEKFRQLLEKFVVANEKEDGDTVVNFFSALFQEATIHE